MGRFTCCEPACSAFNFVVLHVGYKIEEGKYQQPQSGRANGKKKQEFDTIWSESSTIDGSQDARTQAEECL